MTEGALVGTADARRWRASSRLTRCMWTSVSRLRCSKSCVDRRAGPTGDGQATILDARGQPYPVKGEILFSGINVDAGTGDVVLRGSASRTPSAICRPACMSAPGFPGGGATEGHPGSPTGDPRTGDGLAGVSFIDGRARRTGRPSQLGKVVDGHYLVSGGLKAGDKLVVEGWIASRTAMP